MRMSLRLLIRIKYPYTSVLLDSQPHRHFYAVAAYTVHLSLDHDGGVDVSIMRRGLSSVSTV